MGTSDTTVGPALAQFLMRGLFSPLALSLALTGCGAEVPQPQDETVVDSVAVRLLAGIESTVDDARSSWMVSEWGDTARYGARHVQVHEAHYLVLERVGEASNSASDNAPVDVLRLPPLAFGQEVVLGSCKRDGRPDRRIAAIASPGEQFGALYETVHRAWVADLVSERFEPTSADDIQCEDVGFVGDHPPPQEPAFSYSSTAPADLTGDGFTDTLDLRASGDAPLDVEVTFTVRAMGREIHRETWESHEYFRYEPELATTGTEEAKFDHVERHLAAFFDSANFVRLPAGATLGDPSARGDYDDDPVVAISFQLRMPVVMDSLRAAGVDSVRVFRRARELTYASQHPAAESIWGEMTASDLMTFVRYAGGERTSRLAWSTQVGRFFAIWSCC